jgi:ketohexokinase
MVRILVTGLAALDIISRVDGYPAEDSEVRALDQRWCRGGNGANTAVVLAQLGHQCTFAGILADEPNGRWILEDLQRYGIDTGACRRIANGKAPVSCITVNARSGSRTIVHYRDLPEFNYQDFTAIDLKVYDWIHFEGRNIGETRPMMARAKKEHPGTWLSVEIEKPRPEDECQLFDAADVLLFLGPTLTTGGFLIRKRFLRLCGGALHGRP